MFNVILANINRKSSITGTLIEDWR